jgi:hypothetical protein
MYQFFLFLKVTEATLDGIFWNNVIYSGTVCYNGARGSAVVEALCYKPEVREIDS